MHIDLNSHVSLRHPVAITGAPKAKMNYVQYEAQIVQRYKVVIKGWPLDKFANPTAIGSIPKLSKPRDALVDGSCCWERISDGDAKKRLEDWEKAGDVVHAAQKQRSDAGYKCKHPADDEPGHADTSNEDSDAASSDSDL